MKICSILGLVLSALLLAGESFAATNTITSTNDTTTGGTLRWAIIAANTNPGPDTVLFSLGVGASISPTGQLPSVTNAFTTIDGTTQTGYSITNLVRIYGKPAITNGFDITASNCTVKALAIYGFGVNGIYLHGGNRGVVQGCHLLTNGAAGITCTGSGHLIGGTNAAQRNVISANTNGIYLAQGYSSNTIIGNFIGTDVTGTRTNGNSQSGIYVDHNSGNLIGSVTNGARNIISGNAHGIYLNSSNAAGNVIINNYIGLDSNGTARLGNFNSGIYLDAAQRNRIGGTNVAERNYISANLRGVVLYERGSFSNVVQGNYIGLSTTGAMMSNEWHAILIQHAPSNTIGGAVSGAGNVIGGGQYGIYMEGTNTCGTIIQGNKIGTDPSGSSARPFAYVGIALGESRFTQIGGPNDYARNLVSGSLGNGITTATDEGGDHVIEGNYIGVDLGGTVAIGNEGSGISISRPGCRIGGTNAASRNVIAGNGDAGIVVGGANATNVVIYGNYIGVDATGTNALANQGNGIYLSSGVRGVSIGKGIAGCGNVISGNGDYGIFAYSGCAEMRILNNYIGVDISGVRVVSNGFSGIYMLQCSQTNYIGGLPAERNVIAGNANQGVHIQYCTGIVIRANLVGLGTNNAVLGNAGKGIQIDYSRDFQVGGTTSAEGNLVGGNRSDGILLSLTSNGYIRNNFIGVLPSGTVVSNGANGISLQTGSGVDLLDNVVAANGGQGMRISWARNCTVAGNYIGTDPLGFVGRGNMSDGIYLDGVSVSNTIGGGNVISGNGGAGIFGNDVVVSYTTIIGNKIGTDSGGVYGIGNNGNGIGFCGPHHTRIGGTNASDRNIVSGNEYGISMVCGGRDNQIMGNYIGVDFTGTNAIPNAGIGVFLGSGASNNIVGGQETGAGNVIAFNRSRGVCVSADSGNQILGNSIRRNESLGIDLGYDGVTANDSQDPDGGANLLQNYPVILFATNNGTTAVIKGYLNSRLSKTYLIEVFGSRDPDLTGYGEGEVLLGRTTVATDGAGMANFTSTVSTVSYTPNFITATATDTNTHDTSEFSLRFMLDSDGDGMADGYEVEYFGGHTAGDPAADSDFDGVNNLGEFNAETDPWVLSSCLKLTQFWREPDGDRFFTIAASDCRNYRVEYYWDFMVPPYDRWYDIFTITTRTNGSVTLRDGSGIPNDFTAYRVWAIIP